MAKLRYFRGDTLSLKVEIKKDGAVVDITGWEFYFTVKAKLSDPDDKAKLKIINTASDHADPLNGITIFTATPDKTNLVGEFSYDVQCKKNDGTVITIIRDRILFEQDVTLSA